MRLKYEFMIREIMGEYVVIPSGESAIAVSGMIITNDVGALLWESLKEDVTREELVARLLEEFEIDTITAIKDVDDFIDQLSKLGCLCE